MRNAYNATQNMRGGMAWLRWLLAYYRGNIAYALAAYNAGEGRVDHYKGVPPFPETRAYVRRVIGLYASLSHGFDERLTGLGGGEAIHRPADRGTEPAPWRRLVPAGRVSPRSACRP